jgi:hypothetical protein
MITDDIYKLIISHFAKKWSVTPDKIIVLHGKDSIEVLTTYTGVTTYYLEFTIDWGGSYEEYWGEITHSELLEELIKKIRIIMCEKNYNQKITTKILKMN